jgi:glycosyltransferase involved in cell wall biosynthesis
MNKKTLKICMLTTSFLPEMGGMEMVIDILAREMIKLGHKCVVIAQQPRKIQFKGNFPYPVIHYKKPWSHVLGLRTIENALKNAHRVHQFDLVHAHMAYPTGYAATKLAKRLHIPVVVTSHKGDIIPESRYRQRLVTSRRMQWALTECDMATGVSVELKEIIDALTDNKAHSHFIPNGVFLPDEGSLPVSCPYDTLNKKNFILSLGRLHHYKGIDILLKAFQRFQKVQPDLTLVLAGEGREKEALMTQAKELGISDKVLFTGAVFGEEKSWLMHNCRFFVQPSRAEGMPLTLLEAMAHGKASIGTNISGVRELLKDSVNGLMIEPENVQQLIDAMNALCDESRATQYGEEGKKTIIPYLWPSITSQYLEYYRELCSKKR